MDKSSNSYVVVFAIGICVACSALLAITFESLKGTIDGNKKLDIQKNILKASGLWDPATEAKTAAELSALYTERVTELVVDRETGEVVEGAKPDLQELTKTGRLKQSGEEAYPDQVALFEIQNGDETIYCLPTSQYGLWSWMHGFLAVDGRGREVRGITYYEQGETPGLGGEVENPNWQRQWVGKSLYEGEEFIGVTVKKGKVDTQVEKELNSFVDGLAGATITSNGVTRDMKTDIHWYDAFFARRNG